MNRVIIGSSNVYRFYKSELYKDYNAYTMARCTDIKSFDAIMTNLEPNDTEVVISVLENFLDKAGRNETTEEGWCTMLGETFLEFNRIVKSAAIMKPDAKFVIIEPIKRPSLDWYQRMYEDILTTFAESIQSMRLLNLTGAEGIPEGCQQFEQDQVHLTGDSGQIFMEGILTKSEAFFKAPIIDLDDIIEPFDEEMMEEEIQEVDLATRVGKLEAQIRSRQHNDNLVFARLREESDSAANKLKEDRVIITGITSKTFPPAEPEQRKVWIKEIAMNIFKTLIPDFKGEIHFVNQAKNNGLYIPMIEVKLDSVESSANVRKAFAEKRKMKADLGKIFIANSVGLTTRIRVDILKALARKVSNMSVSAHVLAFVSRPVMHVRPKIGSVDKTPPRTFTFVDAVVQYGHLLKQVELSDAYRRAGIAFKGQLEQLFVVLREKDETAAKNTRQPEQHQQQRQHEFRHPGKSGQVSRKRRWEDDEAEAGGSSSSSSSYRGQGRGKGKRFQRGGK